MNSPKRQRNLLLVNKFEVQERNESTLSQRQDIGDGRPLSGAGREESILALGQRFGVPGIPGRI